MKHKIFVCLLLAGFLPGVAAGQTKVGSGIDYFLQSSASVRANGMGEAGVALIDNYSAYFNPASLGLLHRDNSLQLTFYRMTVYDIEVISPRPYSLSVRLKQGELHDYRPFIISAAYYTNKSEVAYPLTTYGNPEGTGEYFIVKDIAHNFVFGFGILSSMELGFGTNIKIIRENYDGLKSTGIAFDFGFLARASSDKLVFPDKQDNDIRPYFSPSVGLSWNNLGPDMEIAGNTIPITGYGRLGFAGPIGMEKKIKTGYMMLFKFTPSLELFVDGIDSFQPRYGGELSIIEALDFRLGHISTPWHIGFNTWGLGLKSQGIVKLFSDLLSPDTVERHDPVTQFLRAKLQIEFDYAHQNIDDNSFFQFEDDYYGISLSL